MSAPPRIARVIIDLDVPHLDRPFDYLIPARMQGSVALGSLVRVRWGHRRVSGWVIELANDTEHQGELSPLLRVLSVTPLFSEAMLTTYRYLAARYAVNLSQVLSLAIPARRQKVEESLGQVRESPSPPPLEASAEGDAFSSPLPRSVLQVAPHNQWSTLESLFLRCWHAKVPLIVVAPTLFLAKTIIRHLKEKFPTASLGFQASELPQTARYETHLRALRGEYTAVVGTRSAAWTPVREPAVLAIWDDGSEHYRERRAPHVDALDIGVARVRWEDFGLVSASYSRSVKAQMLVKSGWASSVAPDAHTVRANAPRIRISDPDAFEREGFASLSTLPDVAFRAAREGLQSGPVLVQVIGVGKFITLPCHDCGNRLRCGACGSALEGKHAPHDAALMCDACGEANSLTQCPKCQAGPLRTLEVGADRVGRDLGRAFPTVPIVVSSSTSKIRRRIRATSQLVVATPGAEPLVTGGYAAVIVLEADRVAYSDRVNAEEEAARRWFNTFALSRPGAPGVLAGEVPDRMQTALVRWRPIPLAESLLEDLKDVGLYPTRWVVGLEGPAQAVREAVTELESGKYTLEPAEPPLLTLGYVSPEDRSEKVNVVVSCEPRQAMSLMHHLKTLAKQRSLQRGPVVKAVVNPPQFHH